ncbi:MAG: hypothetical protein ACTHMC_07750, partial [Pseudobacter sp.]|uniref:hypothetical protein n=1 Tax=Pseudobacter sp. TaxID=2045420 RepID=UPI003F816D5D
MSNQFSAPILRENHARIAFQLKCTSLLHLAFQNLSTEIVDVAYSPLYGQKIPHSVKAWHRVLKHILNINAMKTNNTHQQPKTKQPNHSVK